MKHISALRRYAGVAAVAVALPTLAACSTGSTAADDAPEADSTAEADAFPVTIEHAYGETTITDEPERIVTIGWSDHDVLLSLGVVPVGAQAITWGGNDAESTTWFDAELDEVGGEQPERLNMDASIPYNDIAALSPDLILATNSGITQEDYDKLTETGADVVAFPGAPWLTSWQDSLEMIGRATGRVELAQQVHDETQAALDQVIADHPEFTDTSFLVTGIADNTVTDTIGLYGPGDARPQLLGQIGLQPSPVADELVPDDAFYVDVSAEKAQDLESDLLINLGFAPGSYEALTGDARLSQIPAVTAGRYLDLTDQEISLTFSAASTLSIPYFIDELVPHIATAVGGEEVNVTP